MCGGLPQGKYKDGEDLEGQKAKIYSKFRKGFNNEDNKRKKVKID